MIVLVRQDLQTGRELKTLQGHTEWVTAVALSPDGRYALSGSDDHTLKLWDLMTGTISAEFSVDCPISAIALSASKWTIVAGDKLGRVHFLNLENPGA
jgi:WD40 repeat protein